MSGRRGRTGGWNEEHFLKDGDGRAVKAIFVSGDGG